MTADSILLNIRRLEEAYRVLHGLTVDREFSDLALAPYLEDLRQAKADVDSIVMNQMIDAAYLGSVPCSKR